MIKQSAGLFVYRKADAGVEIVLVHPSGSFFKGRDDGACDLPKGDLILSSLPLGPPRGHPDMGRRRRVRPAENDLMWIRADLSFDPIAEDPRFQDLLRRIGVKS